MNGIKLGHIKFDGIFESVVCAKPPQKKTTKKNNVALEFPRRKKSFVYDRKSFIIIMFCSHVPCARYTYSSWSPSLDAPFLFIKFLSFRLYFMLCGRTSQCPISCNKLAAHFSLIHSIRKHNFAFRLFEMRN